MATEGVKFHDHGQQVGLLDAAVHDTTPTMPTGFDGIDQLLRRGGLMPGNFAVLGGRTGTRKTTVMLNMAVSLAKADIPVGVLGLDESPWMYVVKLMSAWSGKTQDRIEQVWDDDEGKQLQRDWRNFAHGRLHFFSGQRPTVDQLSGNVEMTNMGTSRPPKVLFIDYMALMARKGYGFTENARIPELTEDLQVWSSEYGIVLVVLHQLSRNDEHGGGNSRNAGHIPVTLAQLKYGGEEQADIVLGTYRPSMNPLALMSYGVAKEVLGDRFDEEVFWEARAIAQKYARSTFLQLLKNRPGTHREERGVELLSEDESLSLVEKQADEPEEDDDGGRDRAEETSRVRRRSHIEG